ncbi:hypothetical protein BHE74_00025486 [Ensete ventricosum]|nr:hypothetical protein BHE74_00025486 [Ensete ventricosum]
MIQSNAQVTVERDLVSQAEEEDMEALLGTRSRRSTPLLQSCDLCFPTKIEHRCRTHRQPALSLNLAGTCRCHCWRQRHYRPQPRPSSSATPNVDVAASSIVAT